MCARGAFLISSLLPFPNKQSNRETERVSAWKLLLESCVHPWWDGSPATSATTSPGKTWIWPEGTSQARVTWCNHTAETTVRCPSEDAGSHTVCRSHHWEGRSNHQKHHQADTVQVSYFTKLSLIALVLCHRCLCKEEFVELHYSHLHGQRANEDNRGQEIFCKIYLRTVFRPWHMFKY